MNDSLFGREAVLVVGQTTPGKFFTTVNEVTIRELRVTFSVEASLEETPNASEIVIFNLNEASRGECQRDRSYIRLDAGYVDLVRRLCEGDVTHCASTWNGTEWETKLQIGDGARAYNHARVSRTFAAGTDVKTVLGEVAGSMDLRVPSSIDDARELLDQFARGVTVSGPSHKAATKMLRPRGLSWSVQNGQMQILRDGGTRPDEAIVINSSNGMLGSPEFGPPKEKGKSQRMTLRTLLRPELVPGGKISVEARNTRGLFKITRARHRGDTHARDPWETELEAIPL